MKEPARSFVVLMIGYTGLSERKDPRKREEIIRKWGNGFPYQLCWTSYFLDQLQGLNPLDNCSLLFLELLASKLLLNCVWIVVQPLAVLFCHCELLIWYLKFWPLLALTDPFGWIHKTMYTVLAFGIPSCTLFKSVQKNRLGVLRILKQFM